MIQGEVNAAEGLLAKAHMIAQNIGIKPWSSFYRKYKSSPYLNFDSYYISHHRHLETLDYPLKIHWSGSYESQFNCRCEGSFSSVQGNLVLATGSNAGKATTCDYRQLYRTNKNICSRRTAPGKIHIYDKRLENNENVLLITRGQRSKSTNGGFSVRSNLGVRSSKPAAIALLGVGHHPASPPLHSMSLIPTPAPTEAKRARPKSCLNKIIKPLTKQDTSQWLTKGPRT